MADREISNFDIDVLAEIGNIGAGNAATALSLLLNKTIQIEVPQVDLCDLTKIPEMLGGSEVIRTGIFFSISNSVDGYMMFLLADEDVDRISNILSTAYGPMDSDSIMTEVANIIAGSYVGALATMLNGSIEITPPQIGHDMLGSLIDAIISSMCAAADKTVIIRTKLIIDKEVISCSSVLLLEMESLNKLLEYFTL